MVEDKLVRVLEGLKGQKKRNFNQSADLIINLKNFDAKKESVNLFLTLPHKIKDVKVAAFLNKESGAIDTITQANFGSYKDKKKVKKLSRKYDFFIASANLMPQVASVFGKYLGPLGKMPSPQIGILTEESEGSIKELLGKLEKGVKIKSKEPSLKFIIGKENMKNGEIIENIKYAYNAVVNALPKKKESVKSIMLRLTMTKPTRIEL